MNHQVRNLANINFLKLFSIILITCFYSVIGKSQIVVYSDDFSNSNANYYTNGQQIGTNNWTITSVPDWGGRIFGGIMELTNDASGTSNANGSVRANLNTSNFLAPYSSVLKNNPGLVTWTFNMRQIRSEPAGFSSVNSYGVAFILASGGGNGYAVTLGESGDFDYVRLEKFTGGFPGTRTPLITGADDIGLEHLSIKVTYDPSNDQWTLATRIDGTSFMDPSGGTTFQGSATDATHINSNLNNLAAYWQGSTGGGQTAFFDNLGITVVCTDPSFTASKTDVGCFGGTNGSITVTTNLSNPQFSKDGGANYTTVQSSPYTFSGLTAGSYDIIVKSGTCIAPTSTVVLAEPTQLTATTSQTNEICGQTGTVTITPSGGTSPYMYKLDGGSFQMSNSFTGLASGSHSIDVQDANNCEISLPITIQYLPVKNTNGPSYYATIQQAVTAASPGDVIEVCAGTYNENIVITKMLTLNGANVGTNPNAPDWTPNTRMAESVIKGTIQASPSGLTLDGFVIEALASATLLNFNNTGTGGTINVKNNIFDGAGLSNQAYFSGSNVTHKIQNNIFKNFTTGSTFVLLMDGTSLTNSEYVGNLFTGNTRWGMIIQGSVITPQIISGNNFASGLLGMSLGSGGHTVSNNIFSNTGGAIYTIGSGNMVSNNLFNNTSYSFYQDGSGSGNMVHNNSLLGMNGSGFNMISTNANPIDATCNWWGIANANTIAQKINGPINYVSYYVSGVDSDNIAPGFQPTGLCEGTPVVIDNMVPTDVYCGPTDGSLEVTFSGGMTPYTIEWSGTTSGGPVAAISPFTISPLVAGNYSVVVKDTYGSTDTSNATIVSFPITNLTDMPNTHYATIEEAILAADDGDVIDICSGTFQLSAAININKSITLQGHGRNSTTVELSSSWFNTNGPNALTLNAPNTTIKDIHFKVVGKGEGNIIGIFQSNTTISGNKFSGEYVYGDSEVTRATVWSANNMTNVVMNDNIIESLRQPGYLSNGSGVISNNVITTTRGWVIEGAGILAMTGNIYGSNTSHVTILVGANIAVLTVNNNDLSGTVLDWAIDNRTATTLDAMCNWYGTKAAASIALKVSGPVTVSTWLVDGTDDNVAPGFQPVAGACSGTPIVISAITPDPITCGETTGSIDVAFSGGAAPYSISWTGTSSGSTPGISSGYDIPSLTAGTYNFVVTDANGSTATGSAIIEYLPVTNTSDGLYFATIQGAIDAATTGSSDVIEVCQGTYMESVVINKNIHLKGLTGQVDNTFIMAPSTLPSNATQDSYIVKVAGSGVSAEISGLTIKGPGPGNCNSIGYGILVRDDAYANIHDNKILEIRDQPFSGCQNGVAIQVGRQAWSTVGTASITNNTISGYQKNGITVDNIGSNAIITGNTITGAGTTPIIAQNGLQVSRGATATINGNTISGNSFHVIGNTYDWGSTGILLFQSGTVALTGGNNLTGNDQNYYAYEPAGTISLGAEIFGTSTAPVGFGNQIVNVSTQDLDLRTATFGGLSPGAMTMTQLFELEDFILHKIDNEAYGFVYVKTGNTFVTPLSFETGNAQIQRGIDAASNGFTVNVRAGSYAKQIAPNKSVFGVGSYQFGLFVDKANLTLKGYGAGDAAVTNAADAAVMFTTGATNNFGSSGIFVQSNGVTIEGLKVGNNLNASDVKDNNKTIEVVGDNLSLTKNWFMPDADEGTIYLGRWDAGHAVNSYNISNNKFDNTLISVNNGVGISGAETQRLITNNTFNGIATPYLIGLRGWSGPSPVQGWIVDPVGGAIITGNTFNNTGVQNYIQARGNDGGYIDSQINWSDIWTMNTYGNRVITLVDEGTFDPRTYDAGGYAHSRRITPFIQENANIGGSGDIVLASAGTFNESLNINNEVTLKGAGVSNTFLAPITNCAGAGITVNANNAGVQNLTIQNYQDGIVASGVVGLSINNVKILEYCRYGVSLAGTLNSNLEILNSEISRSSLLASTIGIRAGTASGVEALTIDQSIISGNTQGISIFQSMSPVPFNNVTISNSTISNNSIKGMYFEKLSNATFDGLTMANNGTDNSYANNAGIDINLKYGNYSNIIIKNSEFTNSGYTGTATDPESPVVIGIKARDDASSYNSIPATLIGVQILNNKISGPQNGIRFGEYGKTNAGPSNVLVQNNDLSFGFANKAVISRINADISLECNWHGSTDLNTITNTFSKAGSGDINLGQVLAAGGDASGVVGFQPVAACTCPNGNLVTVGAKTFCTIQAAIDDADTDNGDMVVISAGTYIEDIIVNKEVKLLGPNANISPNTGSRVAEVIIHPATSSPYGEIIKVVASNVEINGLTINGDNPSLTSNFLGTNGADLDAAEAVTVYVNNISNLLVKNNIIENLTYFGVTVYGADFNAPATSGHLVDDNLFRNLGTYDAASGIEKWGGGVLIYNSQYTGIANNKMVNVRIGVQSGNFHNANPGGVASQTISNNQIQTRRRGVFYNLHTGPGVSPLTLSGNIITGITNANETDWDGILAASLSDAAGIISNNMIDGSGVSASTQGIEVWNVNPSAPVSITGGDVSNVGVGVYVNNYEGYSSNAGNTGAIIDGINLTNNVGLGIYIKDSPSNTNGSTVFAEIKGNTEINTNPNGTGILIEGSDASANIHDNLSTITGNEIGVLVDNGNAIITNNTISANNIGIKFQNSGTGNAQSNNITSNSLFGIENTTGVSIIASNNWWGDATGPSGVGPGIGDAVSQNVYYCPWLDNSVGTGVAAALPVFNQTKNTYHCSIQDAIINSTNGDIILVSAGTYKEDVLINKDITLTGSGSSTTIISGIKGGDGATVRIASSGVILEGFGITREGNNPTEWNDPTINNGGGIAIQGQAVDAEIRFCHIYGNRTGIDVNNSNDNNIHDNDIENNRTGLIFRNETNNTQFNNNFVKNNWTVGIVFLDASGGTNSPIQSAASSSFNNNNISGNWYGQIVDRQTGGSLPAPGTNLKNFECNWFGTTTITVVTTNSTEPGYAAQIPVMFGGSAVPPASPEPEILGAASANIDYEPFLIDGTDNDGGAFGFQIVPNSCLGCNNGSMVYNMDLLTYHCSIQDAIDNAGAGNTIVVQTTNYTEPGQIIIDKNITLKGQGKGATTVRSNYNTAPGGHDNNLSAWILTLPGTNVTIKDMTLDATGINTYTALRFQDDGLVENVAFNQIKHSASPYLGIAVQVQDGNVNVTGSMFTNIGRIGVHYRNGVIPGATISGTYSGNMYTGKGDGDWLDYALDISGGTTINVTNNEISDNTGEAVSDGSTSAGILVTSYFPTPANSAPNNVTINGNDLHGNSIGIAVGFDAADISNVVATGNDIYNNDLGISSTGPNVSAGSNYWGAADGPGGDGPGSGNGIVGNVDACPFYNDFVATGTIVACRVVNTTTLKSYNNIQDAIDDPLTLNGHTITAAAGDYFEHIQVNKQLTILGAKSTISGCDVSRGSGESIIYPSVNNATDFATQLFNLTTSNITIDGFTLDGDNPSLGGTGDYNVSQGIVGFTGQANVHVLNNVIQNFKTVGVILADDNGSMTSGNTIENNKIENISPTAGFGIGVYTGNNTYADIKNNCMDQVRKGIQGGENNYIANTGNVSPVWSGNTITSYKIGIWNNLAYQNASPVTIMNNVVNTISGSTENSGIEISSIQNNANVIVSGNTVNDAFAGINLWNNPTTIPLEIGANTFVNCDYGVFANNYDGFNSNAATSVYIINGGTITGPKIAGVYVKDNVTNSNGSTVAVEITGNPIISGTVLDSKAFLVEGGGASLSFSGTAPLATVTGLPSYFVLQSNGADKPATDINATEVLLDGSYGSGMALPTLFTTEDKIVHKIDDPGLGFVTVLANQNFVTTNSFVTPATTSPSVQRAVDVAASGWTVNIANGSYLGDVNIDKTELTISGQTRDNTILKGLYSGGLVATLTIPNTSANNAYVKNLTVSRDYQDWYGS